MGLFSFFKEVKSAYKHISKYMNMSYDDLCSLDDEELKEAISIRMTGAERRLDVEECLTTFFGAKKIYYVINYFDMEVQNGGLCQYFVNSSRLTAPYILDSLKEIGATSFYKLLDDFINVNNINLNNLDSFIIQDIDEFESQTKRYPFDSFDEAYYNLYENESLEDMLFKYVKKHLNDF